MLLTLQQFDDEKLKVDGETADEKADGKKPEVDQVEQEKRHEKMLQRELDGLHLRTANWKVLPSNNKDEASFQYVLPKRGLAITKTYRLAQVPEKSRTDADYPAYHLEFEIEIRNVGSQPHKVAYRLDGPNGLPTEGAWYATRVTRSGGSGLRDFIIRAGDRPPVMVGATYIATNKAQARWPDEDLRFIGVDAQYFSTVLLPHRTNPTESWFDDLLPICAGKLFIKDPRLANSSCRMIGNAHMLAPGTAYSNRFMLFAGPKKPAIVDNPKYRLGDLVYYGWFGVVAKPLAQILHVFYLVVGNYGLAIILLTVLVRGCMFPLSRKQVVGAQKMQQLQPEIKRIQEKYKGNVEARTKAQQELFHQHNYNPLSGCLPIFIQMPVFIGLYRSLMVAIELRDAPLFSSSIRWCSNLAAPDMLYNWSGFMPAFVAKAPAGGLLSVLFLGPYFNLLPIVTVILFIWQQKMFMPPAADEQAAMQQKIMQYMMIFMGLLFFKVASGLCIYFVASSAWSVAERKLLPKTAPPTPEAVLETRAEAKARAREAAEVAARQQAAKAKKGRGR